MNWYKKTQHEPQQFEWDRIRRELLRELQREPTADEIQQRLYDKFWHSTDIAPQRQLQLFEA